MSEECLSKKSEFLSSNVYLFLTHHCAPRMCVSTNTSLEPYVSTPDPDWSRWSKDAVREYLPTLQPGMPSHVWVPDPPATPIAAEDQEVLVSPSGAMALSALGSTGAVAAPVTAAPSPSELAASQDPTAVPVAAMAPTAGLSISATTATIYPSTPLSARWTRRVENVLDLPTLDHVESLEWLRGVLQSHLESQWRE